MIWMRVLELQQKLDRKTSIPHSQETAGYGSRLIAFLNLFLRSIDAEDAAKKYRKDFDHILKQSDLDKAILVLDDNPHLLRTNNGSQKKEEVRKST